MTQSESFTRWLQKPGGCRSVVYHRGFLMRDRADDPELARLAQSVLDAASRGDVALFQRRVGTDRYEYIAHLASAAA